MIAWQQDIAVDPSTNLSLKFAFDFSARTVSLRATLKLRKVHFRIIKLNRLTGILHDFAVVPVFSLIFLLILFRIRLTMFTILLRLIVIIWRRLVWTNKLFFNAPLLILLNLSAFQLTDIQFCASIHRSVLIRGIVRCDSGRWALSFHHVSEWHRR